MVLYLYIVLHFMQVLQSTRVDTVDRGFQLFVVKIFVIILLVHVYHIIVYMDKQCNCSDMFCATCNHYRLYNVCKQTTAASLG